MNNTIEDYLTITNNGLDVDANNVNANCITSKNNTFSMDTSGNLICNSITTNVSSGVTFDQIYPVGSIYLSMNDVNPGTLFGGTWVKITDRFLIGAGNNYVLGATGGQTSHNHTSPVHSHGYGSLYTAIQYAGTYGTRYRTKTGISFTPNERKADGGAGYNYSTSCSEGIQIYGSTGNNSSANTGSTTVLPPYLAVNIWKRTN